MFKNPFQRGCKFTTIFIQSKTFAYFCIMILEFLGFLRLSLVDILDILTVALIIYLLFKWLRGSSAMNIFIAIILLLIIRVVAVALNMKMLSALMGFHYRRERRIQSVRPFERHHCFQLTWLHRGA